METIKRTTVKAFIEKDGKVFMVKDGKGMWEFPGGKIDGDESEEEALTREAKEELDIDKIDIGSQIGNFEIVAECYDKMYKFNVVVRKCQADLSNVILSDEHTESAWVDPAKIDKYQMREGYKKVILELND